VLTCRPFGRRLEGATSRHAPPAPPFTEGNIPSAYAARRPAAERFAGHGRG
jgi:hypothetical protein